MVAPKKASKSSQRWFKTRIQNLVRHKSGVYYVRTYSGGKEKWASLKTKTQSIAEVRMAEHIGSARTKRRTVQRSGDEKTTMGEAMVICKRQLEEDATLRPNTKEFYKKLP